MQLVDSFPSYFTMIGSCSMLFDSSKLSNLMLFLPCPVISAKSMKLLLFAIFPCVLEHVLLISGDSSVFMFCHALSVYHVHAFCFHIEVLHIVLMLARCLVAVLDRLSCCLVWSVCVAPLLRFECALYETFLILHVVPYY